MSYQNIACPNCGRHRVLTEGVCEKCQWDVTGGDYVLATRPAECFDNVWVGAERAAEWRRLEQEGDDAWAKALHP